MIADAEFVFAENLFSVDKQLRCSILHAGEV